MHLGLSSMHWVQGELGGGWGAAWVPVPEDADGASACHSQVGVMMESPSQESL